MMKAKRLLSAVLAVFMLSAVPAGCGTKEAPAGDRQAKTSEVEKPKPELKALGVFQAIIRPNEDPVEKEIEKVTGYKVQYSMLPQDKGDEKLFLEIASGTEYDIIKITPNQYYKLVGQDALQPIDELLNKFGGNIKQAVQPDSWELSTYNDKIYGIPQKGERPAVSSCLGIRKDILDELGLKLPETLEDFYQCLKTIKEKKKDMIPMTAYADQGNIFMHTVISAFGLYTEWADVSGNLVNRVKMPQTKDYIEFITQLYKEELLDKDYPINKSVNMNEKFTSGKAAAVLYNWGAAETVVPALAKSVPNGKIAVIHPLKGKNGELGIDTSVKLNYISCVPKSSKHAEDAVKFMDIKLKFENFQFLTLGTQGETFTVENGKYYPIMPKFNEMRNTAYWYLHGMDEKRYPDMWLARVRRNADVGNTFDEMNKDFDKYAKFDVTAFKPPLESFTKYEQVTKKQVYDGFIKFITGADKVQNFDAFVQAWDKAGGAEMTKEINAWYQAKKKK